MTPASHSAPAWPAADGARPDICVPGRNCWRIARATRVAFLVDGDAYFRAFAEAVARARESVLVVGWDIQAATRLQPGAMPNGWPPTLREFLGAALSARSTLEAHVLDWDFSLLFALERELLPVVQLGWLSHPRLHFALDATHPLTASHHQKIVVVDDAVAFVGGLDLTTSRWDTPAHAPDDPRRRLPNGKVYGPFHDVQIAVAGPAARALAELARARWERATGERLRPVTATVDRWPGGVPADLEDVDVAIARTEPAFEGRPPVREVEALYVDAIAAARHCVYLENQYFTSTRLAEAIAARLAEPAGPEIVLVGPRVGSGWLEERTMGAVRARLLHELRAADRHGRFRAYAPRLAGAGGTDLNVHAKVMIVDDALLRIGSSNMSNRSMGLDTECDVAVERRGDARVAGAIAGLRDRLLAEHLGATPRDVAAAIAARGSLVAGIDRLRSGPRTLVPLLDDVAEPPTVVLPDIAPVDLEVPVAHAPFVAWLLPPSLREPAVRMAVHGTRALVGIVLTAIAWEMLGLPRMLAPVSNAFALMAMSAAYVAGAAFEVPITALHTVSALVLGPERGPACAVVGAAVADGAAFAVGRWMPRRRLARLAGRHLGPIMRLLVPGRVRDVAAVRLSVAAPFPVLSLAAGAARVPLWRLLLGTVAVVAPTAGATAFVVHLLGG